MTRTDPTPDIVEAVWERDGGSCAMCARGLHRARRGTDWSIHHRGGRGNPWSNQPSNLLTLCGDGTRGCHGWVTREPRKAKQAGLSVNRLGTLTAADIPLEHARWGVVFLLDADPWISHEPPEEN